MSPVTRRARGGPTGTTRVVRNPARWSETVGRVEFSAAAEVGSAATTAAAVQGAWATVPQADRAAIVADWAARLAARVDEVAEALAREIGKPVADGREEAGRAVERLALTAAAAATPAATAAVPTEAGPAPGEAGRRAQASEVRRPIGVVGAITPWNNPVAIPAGKLGPALAFGNGVVWKPSWRSPSATRIILECLAATDAPEGLVGVVHGDAVVARAVVSNPAVAAVTFTGSVGAGRAVISRCARLFKPVQAELGGNNAAIVLADADLNLAARDLARSAYGFAGQRCTATRRLVLAQAIAGDFLTAFEKETSALHLGDPADRATQVGPLVSRSSQARVTRVVAQAVGEGGTLVFGGGRPAHLPAAGCFFEPTLIVPASAEAEVVQQETFGPVAVAQPATDLDHALELANGVAHGLVATLYSKDPVAQDLFCQRAQAGVVKLNRPTVGIDLTVPFGGWKASGWGPPEHGRWDQLFYTRPQAVYGAAPG